MENINFNIGINPKNLNTQLINDKRTILKGKVLYSDAKINLVEINKNIYMLENKSEKILPKGSTVNLIFNNLNETEIENALINKSIGKLIENSIKINFENLKMSIDTSDIPKSNNIKLLNWLSEFSIETDKALSKSDIPEYQKKDILNTLKKVIDDQYTQFKNSNIKYTQPKKIIENLFKAFGIKGSEENTAQIKKEIIKPSLNTSQQDNKAPAKNITKENTIQKKFNTETPLPEKYKIEKKNITIKTFEENKKSTVKIFSQPKEAVNKTKDNIAEKNTVNTESKKVFSGLSKENPVKIKITENKNTSVPLTKSNNEIKNTNDIFKKIFSGTEKPKNKEIINTFFRPKNKIISEKSDLRIIHKKMIKNNKISLKKFPGSNSFKNSKINTAGDKNTITSAEKIQKSAVPKEKTPLISEEIKTENQKSLKINKNIKHIIKEKIFSEIQKMKTEKSYTLKQDNPKISLQNMIKETQKNQITSINRNLKYNITENTSAEETSVKSESSDNKSVNENINKITNVVTKAINAYTNIETSKNLNSNNYVFLNIFNMPVYINFKKEDTEENQKNSYVAGRLRIIFPTEKFGLSDIKIFNVYKNININFSVEKNYSLIKENIWRLKENIEKLGYENINITLKNNKD